MSIQAKQTLVNDIEEEVGDFLTVTNTHKVKEVINEQLVSYDVEYITASKCVSTDVLTAFINAKTIEGRSKNTIGRYSYIIERMFEGVGKPIQKITTADLREWIAEEQERGISARSMNGVRSVLSSFFNWCWREGIIKSNPIANIGTIKYKNEIKLPYSDAEIEILKRSCKNDRDLALVCFLLSSGARISEVCSLNRDDIDFEKRQCKVLGKGNKERIVYLNDVATLNLKLYIEGRKDSYPALFVGKGSERMTPHGVRIMLKTLEKRSGIENVHPHRFRRTLATRLITLGMPIQTVSKILGHENINTTMTYIYMDKMDVENSFRRYML